PGRGTFVRASTNRLRLVALRKRRDRPGVVTAVVTSADVVIHVVLRFVRARRLRRPRVMSGSCLQPSSARRAACAGMRLAALQYEARGSHPREPALERPGGPVAI